MSTLAISGSRGASGSAGAARQVRYADLALLAIALPVFLATDLPMLGYAVAAVAWLVQRAALMWAERSTAESLAAGDRRSAFRVTAISTMARVWLVSVSVLLVGLLADREDGLAAALLITALFTVQLVTTALARARAGGEAA